MNREELVTAVAARTGLTKNHADEVLQALLDTITDIVRDGDKVTISGFGTFLLHERAPRQARNPRTGEMIQLGARKAPKFVPGKQFREAAK
jgi:DNA-binding protein HU-beta